MQAAGPEPWPGGCGCGSGATMNARAAQDINVADLLALARLDGGRPGTTSTRPRPSVNGSAPRPPSARREPPVEGDVEGVEGCLPPVAPPLARAGGQMRAGPFRPAALRAPARRHRPH